MGLIHCEIFDNECFFIRFNNSLARDNYAPVEKALIHNIMVSILKKCLSKIWFQFINAHIYAA